MQKQLDDLDISLKTLETKGSYLIRHLFLLDGMRSVSGFDPLEYNGRQYLEWDWANYSESRTLAQQKKHERTCAKNRKRRKNKNKK